MGNKIFIILMVLLWILPPTIKYFELDSYTFTTVGVVSLFMGYNMLVRNIKMDRLYYHFLIISFFLIICNIVITVFLFDYQYSYSRTIGSMVLMFMFLYSAFCFTHYLIRQSSETINRLFKILFYFFVIIIALSPITLNLFPIYPKPIFPYSEPSHMALFFAPVLCYNILRTNHKRRYIYILIGILVALFVKNTTLLVSVFVISAFIYNIYVIPILLLGGCMVFYFADIEYFMSRLDFSNSSTTNLSTLVYLKGFELMEKGLIMSNGFGIGFQQLGYVEIDTPIRDYIIKLTNGIDLNSNDGGFLVAKIVAEFGFLGILIVISYLILLIRSWFVFRKIEISKLKSYEILFFSSVITIFSELFFRGVGYFTSNVFLLIAMVYLNHKLKILKTLQQKFS